MTKLYYYNTKGRRVDGPHPLMTSSVSTGLHGDCTYLRNDCRNLWGDCSGLTGDPMGMRGDCTGLTLNLAKITTWAYESELTSLPIDELHRITTDRESKVMRYTSEVERKIICRYVEDMVRLAAVREEAEISRKYKPEKTHLMKTFYYVLLKLKSIPYLNTIFSKSFGAVDSSTNCNGVYVMDMISFHMYNPSSIHNPSPPPTAPGLYLYCEDVGQIPVVVKVARGNIKGIKGKRPPRYSVAGHDYEEQIIEPRYGFWLKFKVRYGRV